MWSLKINCGYRCASCMGKSVVPPTFFRRSIGATLSCTPDYHSLLPEMDHTDTYSHIYKRPLYGPAKEIRLLRLFPNVNDAGRNRERVSCELIDCPLNGAVEYMALSYTWGDPEDTMPIDIKGVEIQVTKISMLR